MEQLNLFNVEKPKYKIDKPIRLIELFAGIGSQAKALERLGADFETYKVCEFDKYAIKSYNAVHGTDFETSDITELNGKDLEIVDTDKYCYIVTYSFPCQDLSLAGKQKGMEKGNGTRSGLLWEVERILTQCCELPQILLMENVPQVHSKKNIEDFEKWQEFLRSLGYSNYWQDLNAKNYGIPQNRNRCFMVSILGDFSYEFPKPFELKLRLKDMLEPKVEEKYYLNTDKARLLIHKLVEDGQISEDDVTTCDFTIGNPKQRDVANCIIRRVDAGIQNSPCWGNGVVEQIPITASGIGSSGGDSEINGGVINTAHTLLARDYKGLSNYGANAVLVNSKRKKPHTITARGNYGVIEENLRIRKLTPLECWKLMGFDDEDFYRAEQVNSNSRLYQQAGNSIVVNVLEEIFKQLF